MKKKIFSRPHTRRSEAWIANHRRCVQWRVVAMLCGMIAMEFAVGLLGLAEVYPVMRGLLAIGAFIAVWLPADWPCERNVAEVLGLKAALGKRK